MKEKTAYRRFDPVAALAILGCAAMFLFEAFFVFELYDRFEWNGPAVATEVPPKGALQGER